MIRHFTASGIVLHEGRVLLIEHDKLNLWLYPGGHLDPDELPTDALLREIREEVGIDVEIICRECFSHPAVTVVPSPFAVLVEDIIDKKTGPHQHIDMVYVCRPLTHEVSVQMDEIRGYQWVPCTDVADLRTPGELPALVAQAVRYADGISAMAVATGETSW